MSDTFERLRELKGVLAAIASTATVCILIGGALMEYRIGVNVTEAVKTALAAEDLATDDKIIAMDKVAAENTRTGEENSEDIDQNRRNVERAFAALMGRPIPASEDAD